MAFFGLGSVFVKRVSIAHPYVDNCVDKATEPFSRFRSGVSPPFEKGGPGGISGGSWSPSALQIPPNPPFSKGGMWVKDFQGNFISAVIDTIVIVLEFGRK
jgi:hypothetical protein